MAGCDGIKPRLVGCSTDHGPLTLSGQHAGRVNPNDNISMDCGQFRVGNGTCTFLPSAAKHTDLNCTNAVNSAWKLHNA